MPRNYTVFSEAYKIECRAIWYANGCLPANRAIEKNIFPKDEQGNVVNDNALTHWIKEDGWREWKDVMDADLATRTEEAVLETRVKLIQKQLENNVAISDKAFKHIMKEPFDSSAAANMAFFKANAEVRGLMQVQKVIEELTKLETPDIQQRFKELAERAGATIINTTAEDVKEEVAEPLD